MATFHTLTYVVERTLGAPGSPAALTIVAGVGAGIVDVDEMSWDEHLLSHTHWVGSINIKPVYMPERDRVFFHIYTDIATSAWVGSGTFPLDLTIGDRPRP